MTKKGLKEVRNKFNTIQHVKLVVFTTARHKINSILSKVHDGTIIIRHVHVVHLKLPKVPYMICKTNISLSTPQKKCY